MTNRYDIYQQATNKNINAVFSDFDSADYPENQYTNIIYRISKEKALVNHLLNQAATLLRENGKLVISGLKQEGIKSYGDNIRKRLKAKGKLKKTGVVYAGEFHALNVSNKLDDKDYCYIQKVANSTLTNGFFYSKPGLFGWNKVDKGTEILLKTAKEYLVNNASHNKTLLDLGCGYGWIFLNMDKHQFSSIVATDNNAAAIACAKKNSELIDTPVKVLASDCANTIDEKFDFIFCNPPFHQGFKHSQSLTGKFIQNCKLKLNVTGKALFVLNEFVGTHEHTSKERLEEKVLIKKSGFKVIELSHKTT